MKKQKVKKVERRKEENQNENQNYKNEDVKNKKKNIINTKKDENENEDEDKNMLLEYIEDVDDKLFKKYSQGKDFNSFINEFDHAINKEDKEKKVKE